MEQYIKGDYYSKSDGGESVSAGSEYIQQNDLDPDALEEDAENVIFFLSLILFDYLLFNFFPIYF